MSALKLKDILQDGEDLLGITNITGVPGLMKEISQVGVQRYTGEESFWDRLIPDTILIIPPSYLSKLAFTSSTVKSNFFQYILTLRISCIAISENKLLPDFISSFSESCRVPVFASFYDEFLLESRLIGLLREKIQHIILLHGSLVNVFGCGIVITGESNTGKTECACKLTEKGHTWIGDDALEVERRNNILYGRSQDAVKHYIHIKRRGIINTTHLFDPSSMRDETVIDLIIEFQKEHFSKEKEGNNHTKQLRTIMGVTLPHFLLPVFPWSTDTHMHVENIARTFVQRRGIS